MTRTDDAAFFPLLLFVGSMEQSNEHVDIALDDLLGSIISHGQANITFLCGI
jgi:hypothetical protein